MKLTRYISLIIALLSVLSITAQQQQSQYALYNYRNDGDFNAWLNIDVDSITYSNISIDSIEYDNIVTQEVWTPDSCYRIPIEAIDSIGFRAPETEYKEGTFFLNEEHEPYVTRIDDLNIIFNSATPSHLLPAVGQVIVTETSVGILEDGFAGRATSVRNTDDGIEYVCEEVSLSDIFEQLIYVSKCSTTEGLEPEEYLAKSSRKRAFTPGIGIDEVIKIDLDEVETPKKIDGEDMPVQFKYKPEMDITCLISVLKNHPAVAKVTFHHSHTFSLGMDYKGDIIKPNSKEWWFSKKDIRIHIPIAAVDAVIKPYVNFGAFVDYSAKVKFEYELPLLKFEQTFGVDYSEYRKEEDRLQFINDTEFIHDDPTISLSLDGALAFGLAMKIGAKLIHKRLLNFEAYFHVGPEFKGHIDLSTDRIDVDANLYRQLKTTSLDLYGYVAIPKATYKYFGSGVKLAKRGTWKGAKWSNHVPKTEDLLPNDDNPEGVMIDWPIRKWYLLPEFDEPEVYEASGTAAVASVQPSRNLLFPVNVGIAFKDYSTGEVIEKDCGSYWGTNYNAESNYTKMFEDLPPSSIHKVYPTVSLFGMKMDAEPSVDYGVSGKLMAIPSDITIKKGEKGEVTILGATERIATYDANPDIAKSVSIVYDRRPGGHNTLRILGVSEGSTYISLLNTGNGNQCIVKVNVTSDAKPVTNITLSEATLDMEPGGTVTLAATVLPEDAENKNVDWESSNENVATVTAGGLVTAVGEGSCVITCSAVDGSGVFAKCQVTVSSGTIPDPGNHAWVDLGLPSGTLWATCNVGANSPEEYGDYFAWGEVTPKDNYSWGTYKWMNSGQTIWTQINKYTFDNGSTNGCWYSNGEFVGDGLTELLPEDDAATANWGSGWQMPSFDQMQELMDNCSHEWTTQDGVNGTLVTGPNGNTIFLPATGYRYNTSLYYEGSYGLYWSRSLFTDYNGDARRLYFSSDYWGMYYLGRDYGHCVRPVRVKEKVEAHEYVDLGLPSRTLWATCNVGANSPEESGDLFSWGETEPKDSYNWDNYLYCNGSSSTLTKYCYDSSRGYDGFTDTLTELLPEDDAATANWGSEWQMPSKAQFEELINSNNTTTEWTTQGGVYGRLIKSNINGKTIFLPSTRESNVLHGIFWSRTLDPEYTFCARALRIESSKISCGAQGRVITHSVRPVRVLYSHHVTNVILSMTSLSLQLNDTYRLTATVLPEDAENKTVAWESSNESVATVSVDGVVTALGEGSCVITCSATDGSEVYAECQVTVSSGTIPDPGNHAWVDLGLPSGTLWATCNVGADSPEEYGDYFAWGETEPKDVYNWETYKYCKGSYTTMTKYCASSDYGYNGFTDGLTELLPEDDAATANWGAPWHMPTLEQMQELYNNCSRAWTTQGGVEGIIVTGPNSNTIFLPAAGYRWNGELDKAGSFGNYWSSSLYPFYPGRSNGAYGPLFFSYDWSWDSFWYRSYGLSVRPVRP